MYHNFDDDNWSQPASRAKKGGNNDLLLIALLSAFFVLLVTGGIIYYNNYSKTLAETLVQADATPTPMAILPIEVEEEVDPEYDAAVADMNEEEKEAYDAYLTFLERYDAAEMQNPITPIIYGDPVRSVNTLVFALSFDNQPLKTNAEIWNDSFFGEGFYGTGSVNGYFKQVTRGKMVVVPARETQGKKNDGVIRLDMNQAHPGFTGAYYSSADYNAVINNIYSFVKRVLVKGNDYINYAAYDANGDGKVESDELSIVLIFAGYEDAYLNGAVPNATYSAQVTFYDNNIRLDGITMDSAIMTAELSPVIDKKVPASTKGVICHEMGHALGLPDLYDTDYSSEGLAFHSLMAGGSYNFFGGELGSMPPPLMAWSLTELGLAEPEVVTKDGVFYLWSRSSQKYNIIKIPTQNGYYLIENVDFEGYGQGLGLFIQEPGVAIWYVDNEVIDSLYATYMSAVNDDEFRPGVRLVEPYGKSDLLHDGFEYEMVYDHYFRLSGDDSYTGAHGVIINILDDPGETMRIEVKMVY